MTINHLYLSFQKAPKEDTGFYVTAASPPAQNEADIRVLAVCLVLG